MSSFQSKTVLITGGASGLGKLMAKKALERKAKKVILWDINEDLLNQTTAELEHRGFEVHPYIVDVSNKEDIAWAAQDVLENIGEVDILFNNAGIVAGSKRFVDHSDADIERTMNINTLGVMRVASTFLPAMIQQGFGHIINIASAAGLVANPNMSVYAASKWAVIGWSESLRLEMEADAPNVKVLTVTPSYIDTGMFKGVKPPLLTPFLKPTDFVERIMLAIEQNEVNLKAPYIVNAVPLLKGVLPTRVFDYLVGDIMGVYKSMDTFKGKEKSIETEFEIETGQ
jgi:all-trans-retinol dehydrogenase (NAD+)